MRSWADGLMDDEKPWVGISEATDILLMRLAGRRRVVEAMKPDWVAAETARQRDADDDFVPTPELIAELQRRMDTDRGCDRDSHDWVRKADSFFADVWPMAVCTRCGWAQPYEQMTLPAPESRG